ncbi:MAG: hypothetical protein WBI63_07005 [Coriobacteriia bacterium]
MSRQQQMPAAMMAAFAGLQGGAGVAGAFVTTYVMYTLRPWTSPNEAELERAMHAAERYKLSPELAVFLPPEPGRLSRRSRKDAYKGVVIALKRVDELMGDERVEAIAQVRALLGAK